MLSGRGNVDRSHCIKSTCCGSGDNGFKFLSRQGVPALGESRAKAPVFYLHKLCNSGGAYADNRRRHGLLDWRSCGFGFACFGLPCQDRHGSLSGDRGQGESSGHE